MSHRAKESRRRRGGMRCPSCGWRAATPVKSGEGGATKAACLKCGDLFDITERDGNSDEDRFGEDTPSGSSGEVWLIRIAISVLVAAAIAMAIGFRMGAGSDDNENDSASGSAAARVEGGADPVAKRSVGEEVERAEKSLDHEDRAIRQTLGDFLGASSWAQRVRSVRNPGIAEKRMSDYYKDQEDKPFDDIVVSTRITKVGSLVVVVLEGKGLPNKRLVLEKRHGKYLVDWESFVLWQELPWAEIPDAPEDRFYEIRCLIRPLPNNHPSYRGEDWLSFELVHPGTHEVLYGFLKKGGNGGDETPQDVLESGAIGPVTLAVAAIPDSEGQVIISKVLALGWVHPLPEGHRNNRK